LILSGKMVVNLNKPSLHILVCMRERELNNPIGCSCATSGSEKVYDAFLRAMGRRSIQSGVWLSRTGCLMNCLSGPVVVVYPAGDWYSFVKPEQVDEILDKYVGGAL
jgi:(2Fe-2S) ferredoxin